MEKAEELLNKIDNDLKKVLSEKRYNHSLGVMKKAEELAKIYKIDIDKAKLVGLAHDIGKELSKEEMLEYARKNNIGVIIAAAGKAAHLAGAIAANTTLPVIGIPIKSSTLDGLDALLSTVQMPSGVPVATVAIDGAQNSAILAIQMLAIEDETLAQKLQKSKEENEQKILEKDSKILEKYN